MVLKTLCSYVAPRLSIVPQKNGKASRMESKEPCYKAMPFLPATSLIQLANDSRNTSPFTCSIEPVGVLDLLCSFINGAARVAVFPGLVCSVLLSRKKLLVPAPTSSSDGNSSRRAY